MQFYFQVISSKFKCKNTANMLQNDIMEPLPKPGGLSYILTGMDMSSKYSFAQTLTLVLPKHYKGL